MILKVEINERIENIYKSSLLVDFEEKKVTYMKGEVVLANKTLKASVRELTQILKNYLVYWKNEEISTESENNRVVSIDIETDTKTYNYHFENVFPNDLEEFMKVFKDCLEIEL